MIDYDNYSLTKSSLLSVYTIQNLGAEKALFRAIKTKHDTPKYGLIYHASLIGQATPKNKGKILPIYLIAQWLLTKN